MSTKILREAASLMRARANDAATIAPPPWWSGGEWFHYYPPVAPGRDETVHGWPCVGYGSTGVDVVGHNTHRETSDHIASWHPAVALAVADWLDGVFAEADLFGEEHPVPRCECHAHTVARTYLGRDS